MKKTIKMHEERKTKKKNDEEVPEGAVPAYLLTERVKAGQKKRMEENGNKNCYVGEGFTRKPPKFERFIRPMGLRFNKAHVTHPELKATFHLPIIGVKKNPTSPMYTSLGVITKGTVVEVNISELGKYAQVTNNPENDGCINAVLLV
ncbi:unnamed protein product [Mytilus edulis]|uniref:Ribosome biogenesis protein NSA2 homolog n=1 Tax=Mytilus edulis TaxID=6550 RepID=A0A8S3V5Y3_MYTED|nr:unnamed protein product [Mytilus edulis]